MSTEGLTEVVLQYYEQESKKSDFVCRVNYENLSPRISQLVKQLPEECMKRYYGTGLLLPENIQGARILDVGCGSGNLVFLLSKLVGPSGFVVGIDICPGMVEVAVKDSIEVAKLWGYEKPNFEFIVANAEKLLDMGLEPFDAIVSSGVLNVIPEKEQTLRAIYSLLKPGGKFYWSDIVGESELPNHIKYNQEMWYWVSGSYVWDEVRPAFTSQGFTKPYLVQTAGVETNERFTSLLNNAKFVCAAYRMFKLPTEATRGPATVTYRGNIEDYPDAFLWDVDLSFVKGQPVHVDSELASILAFVFKNNFDIVDFHGKVETKKTENPFQLLADLKEKGKAPPPIFTCA